MKLSDEILNKYVGSYQFELGNKLKIKNENNELKLYYSENSITLLANSENHFYATFSFFNIHFKETKNGVEGLDLVTYGRIQKLIKIKE